jgi:hypothetical protein
MTVHVPRWPFALDPLIGEAKRRARQRRFLLASALLIAALATGLTLGLRPTRGGLSARVPKGVTEINIRAPGRISLRPNHANPGISRSITDPSQVKRITGWFDSLQPPGKTSYVCAGGPAASVGFTFRSANGAELAKAYSAPAPAGPCDTIQFAVDGQREMFLVDSNRATPLIHRVQRLLRVKFHNDVYYG